ncbi:hypothetical protein Ahia01_000008100 [Argonauta hians]
MLCYSSPTTDEVNIAAKKYRVTPVRSNSVHYTSLQISDQKYGRVIITQPDNNALNQTQPEPRTTNYIGLAVVVLICFNLPFGVIAVLLSIKSNKEFEAGNFEGGRYKGRLSMIVSVTGISITLVTIILMIFWPVIIRKSRDEHYIN